MDYDNVISGIKDIEELEMDYKEDGEGFHIIKCKNPHSFMQLFFNGGDNYCTQYIKIIGKKRISMQKVIPMGALLQIHQEKQKNIGEDVPFEYPKSAGGWNTEVFFAVESLAKFVYMAQAEKSKLVDPSNPLSENLKRPNFG